jgi:hypothetical protein
MILMIISTKGWAKQRHAIGRLLLASLYWYLASLFMRFIFEWFGSCSLDNITDLFLCKSSDGKWIGFDISGHIFLILHSSLFMIEEMILLIDSLDLIGSVIGLLLCLWYMMLVVTCLYFHPLAELIAGAAVGLVFWIGLYILGRNQKILFGESRSDDFHQNKVE